MPAPAYKPMEKKLVEHLFYSYLEYKQDIIDVREKLNFKEKELPRHKMPKPTLAKSIRVIFHHDFCFDYKSAVVNSIELFLKMFPKYKKFFRLKYCEDINNVYEIADRLGVSDHAIRTYYNADLINDFIMFIGLGKKRDDKRSAKFKRRMRYSVKRLMKYELEVKNEDEVEEKEGE